ncbi:DUF6961 family protein [Erythrobacter ani]|uniref:Uncharacterized protein n=1 Tax=Erythrobacter ani TaxID=2827235 RepID=A0ABS6ST48_9SPHN|nr:hypothetical protein [Erythrobacter ani]MBV7267548.1 hypothetical protein [Erythrobacter ani]
MINRDKELWAMALWAEKHHGAGGWLYITQKQDELLARGEDAGADLWKKVGERFKEISGDSEVAVSQN